MEWITIFEISRFSIPMALLLGLILVFAGAKIIREFWDRENKRNGFTAWTAFKLFFSLAAVIIGAFLIEAEGGAILDGTYQEAAKAYRSGDYAVMEGVAEDLQWTVAGYSFRIGDTDFFCEQYVYARQKKDVEPRLKAGKTLRVSYYDKAFYNEAEQQYEVVCLEVQETPDTEK